MKRKHRLALGILAGLSACIMGLAAAGSVLRATENDKTGSLTIRLSEEGDREGIRFEAQKVAAISDGRYILQAPWKDREDAPDLNDLKTAADLETAARELAEVPASDPVILRTDSQGEARASLEPGVWLVTMTDGGSYGYIAPFLTAIPSWDPDSASMTMDTVTEPKRIPFPDLDLQKTDPDGQAVTGLDFRFETQAAGSSRQIAADPTEGTVTIPLVWGENVIRETQAPAGFKKSDRTITVTCGSEILVNGVKTEPQDGRIELAFENERMPVPGAPTAENTGTGLWIAVLAAAGLVIFFLLRKDRSA